MTTAIDLPALDGRFALGFLAAVGAARLLEQRDTRVKLSWNSQTSSARLQSDSHASVDDVIDALVAVVQEISDEAVLPGVDGPFPPPAGIGRDPLRVRSKELPDSSASWAMTAPGCTIWITSLLTDLVGDPDADVAITPFAAPSGQQKFRTYFEKSLRLVRANPHQLLRQAITGWVRIPGVSGEYLDHRVLFGAADAADGKSAERGVPGATWLATMALPLLTVYADETGRRCVTWRAVPGRSPVMCWPLWAQPLDASAIRAILDHPALAPRADGDVLVIDRASARALGVFAAYTASRRHMPGRKSDGVLAPHGDGHVRLG